LSPTHNAHVLIKKSFVLEDNCIDFPGFNEIVSFAPASENLKRTPYLINHHNSIKTHAEHSYNSFLFNKEWVFCDESKASATILEILGDLPDSKTLPPKNVLFVCNLNANTTEADLDNVFSNSGSVIKCNIVRDWLTGASLNYGFVSFDSDISCSRAFNKLNNSYLHGRHIKLDFSQSVSKFWK